jgi:hypothetical protein
MEASVLCFLELGYDICSEIKCVPTFYLSKSSFEYYDWEDAIKVFYGIMVLVFLHQQDT